MLKFIKIVWWFVLALIPYAFIYEANFLWLYNCPAGGDCYDFAALVKEDLRILFFVSAALIWPVCIWNLGGKYIFLWLRRKSYGKA
jgi:hypothetical protein